MDLKSSHCPVKFNIGINNFEIFYCILLAPEFNELSAFLPSKGRYEPLQKKKKNFIHPRCEIANVVTF